MTDIAYLEDLGDALESAVRDRQASVPAPARRRRRARLRVLAPVSASLVLLGSTGATAFSLLAAGPSMAAEVINCDFPHRHAQIRPTTRSPSARVSVATCRDWYRLQAGARTSLDQLAFVVCRSDANTIEVYASTGSRTPCSQRGEVTLATAPPAVGGPRSV